MVKENNKIDKTEIISNLDGCESSIIKYLLDKLYINDILNNNGNKAYKNQKGEKIICDACEDYIYLNEWDMLKSVEFSYQAQEDIPFITTNDLINEEINIIGNSNVDYNLIIPIDKNEKYAYVIKTILFTIEVKNKFILKIVAEIIMDKTARPNKFIEVFNKIYNVKLVNKSAFLQYDFKIADDMVSIKIDDIMRFSARYGCLTLLYKMQSALNSFYAPLKRKYGDKLKEV